VSFDMNKMMEQVQQMQSQMQQAQEEQNKIDPKAIDPNDPEMLEDMVVAAVNEAIRSAHALVEAKLGPALGGLSGLGLPGM
jgi:DNA-binding protein YbaB